MAKALLGSAATLALVSLSACGGGGGGVGSTPAPPPPTMASPAPTPPPPVVTPPPTPAVNYNTTEYQYSNAAVISGAIAAYDKGATGKGVKAAVIDSGVDASHPDLYGRVTDGCNQLYGACARGGGGRPSGVEDGHGTVAVWQRTAS